MNSRSGPEVVAGTVLVFVPHMDDEALACGGTLALASDKTSLHLVYATDGAASPVPPAPWLGTASPDLPAVRQDEARAAMAVLGIPHTNLRFLSLPDGRLGRHRASLRRAVERSLDEVAPDRVLVPFRFDRHPDHIALHHAVTDCLNANPSPPALFEYFVYYRWRLLPGGDMRSYLDAERLRWVDIAPVAEVKRRALARYESQTTRFFEWQRRPNLTAALLDEVCRTPEAFLASDPAAPGAAVFGRARTWIRIAHRLEPRLKEWKDWALAVWHATLRR